MLVFYIVVGFVLKYTSFGRKIYAIGGNSTASYLCGIKIEKNQIALYVISGTIAAFAGVLATAQAGAAIPQTLNGRIFDVISAVVLGGLSLTGGKGKILGTFVGILVLAIISNGMVLVNLQSYWQDLAKGFILLGAICIDVVRNRKEIIGK